jgi:hypothetical protein
MQIITSNQVTAMINHGVKMKLINNLIITAILFLVFCFATVSCGNESSKKQKNSIIGDYLSLFK